MLYRQEFCKNAIISSKDTYLSFKTYLYNFYVSKKSEKLENFKVKRITLKMRYIFSGIAAISLGTMSTNSTTLFTIEAQPLPSVPQQTPSFGPPVPPRPPSSPPQKVLCVLSQSPTPLNTPHYQNGSK